MLTTRADVLELVTARGSITVDELAAARRITPKAAEQHIRKCVKWGLLAPAATRERATLARAPFTLTTRGRARLAWYQAGGYERERDEIEFA